MKRVQPNEKKKGGKSCATVGVHKIFMGRRPGDSRIDAGALTPVQARRNLRPGH